MKTIVKYILLVFLVLNVGFVQSQPILLNTNFEKKLSSWSLTKEDQKVVSIDKKGGVEQSAGLRISLEKKGVAECTQKISNMFNN